MLNEQLLETIAADVAEQGISEARLVDLRGRYPGVHFTYCMDDDVGSQTPCLSRPGFNLYLVDGREHCLKFTGDLDHATGLVVAEVIPDD